MARGEVKAMASGDGDWKIAENRGRCGACDRPFLADQEFFSRLQWRAEGAGGGYPFLLRSDFCPACWEGVLSGAGEPLIFWKTRRRGGRQEQDLVDLAALKTLFLGLLRDARPEVEVLRYVVGLLLARKKLLKTVRSAKGGRGDLFFRDPGDPGNDRILRLRTPELSEETLALLKEQLGRILG